MILGHPKSERLLNIDSERSPKISLDMAGDEQPSLQLSCLLLSVLLHLVVPDPRRAPAQRLPQERDLNREGERQADLVQRQQVAHRHRRHLRLVHSTPRGRLRKLQVTNQIFHEVEWVQIIFDHRL